VLDLRNTTFPEELSLDQSEQQEQDLEQHYDSYSFTGHSHQQQQPQGGQITEQNEGGTHGNTYNLNESDRTALSQDRLLNDRPANTSFQHECQACQKSFRRQRDLKKHIKTHTRPYKCTHSGCNYHMEGFPTWRECDRHMATHLEQSAGRHLGYCPVKGCPKSQRLQRSDNLARHMKAKHRLEGY